MKTLIALIACVLSVCLTSSAQTELKDIEWKTISESYEELNFDLPKNNLEIDGGNDSVLDLNIYKARYGDTVFSVSTGSEEFEFFEVILDFASKFKPECGTEKIQNFIAYECHFEEMGFYHSFKVLSADSRFYTFYAYSKGKPDPNATKFLGSVQYARQIENAKRIDRLKYAALWKRFQDGEFVEKAEEDKLKTAIPNPGTAIPDPKNIKLGGGSGSGGGSGIGSGSGSIDSKTADNIPLTLFFKPRPGYTEIARRFNIIGTVKLRVVFNSSGKIGTVSIAESLPFGLTQQSINAAKGIGFRPERRKGTNISVKKTVVFNFTIY